jgi:TonB family protein
MSDFWTKWEGVVIAGAYPLHRFLGGSDHSGVFLTEYQAQNLPRAAIKLICVDPSVQEAQLSHLKAAATLSHPHLIQLLDVGRCELGGDRLLFVVMEYAEETLSQILPERALTVAEVRELLVPALDALAFIHRGNLVHCQLKPPNFLVVNEQLKLASDTIRPAGASSNGIAQPSLYDPPEAKNGGISSAGDIWALGVTMVEALTQRPPASMSLPPNVPPAFVETIWRCLSRNPADRPTVSDLSTQIRQPSPGAPTPQARESAPAAPAASAAPAVPAAPAMAVPPAAPALAAPAAAPAIPAPPSIRTPQQRAPRQRWVTPRIVLLIVIVAAATWVARHSLLRKPSAPPTASVASESHPKQAAPPAIASPVPTSAPATPEASAPSSPVLHQALPDVPLSARSTVHGHFNVVVRVKVDRAGNVVEENLESPGPSKYFARLATTAARNWKFVAAESNQGTREWLVWFEFSRDGATAKAVTP